MFKAISGRKIEVKEDTIAGLRQRSLERQREDPKDLAAALCTIVASVFRHGGINYYSKNASGGLWNERLGLRKESLEESIREVLERSTEA